MTDQRTNDREDDGDGSDGDRAGDVARCDAEPSPAVLSYQTPAAPGDRRWVTVWRAGQTVEANLLVTKLQAHGIHARVDMENAATLGPYAGAVYGTKVQVLAADESAARAIVDEIETRRARRVEAESLRCPRCGRADPKRILHVIRWWGWGLIALVFATIPFGEEVFEHVPGPLVFAVFVFGFILIIWWGVTPRWMCKSCGQRWYATEPEAAEEEDEDEDADEDDGDRDDDEADAGDRVDDVTPASSPPSR